MDTKIHESTINAMVSEIMQESNLVDVQHFTGVKLGPEQREELDFKIPGNKICGEGEWKKSVFNGFDRVYKFLKDPDTKGAFLIIYPESLKKSKKVSKDELKAITVTFCYLQNKGGCYIKSHKIRDLSKILKRSIEETIEEIELRFVIDAMQQAVLLLKETIDTAKIDSIFKNNLFAEEKIDVDITLTSAAYFLLNQLIVYRIIASNEKFTDKLEIIEPYDIEKSSDIDEVYFTNLKAVTQDYNVIYSSKLSYFIKDVIILRQILSIVNIITPERISGDFLGKIFQQLIPKQLRKKVASYYTLEESAYLLAKLSISGHDQVVCDPSCGSGTLLCAAYQRKKEVMEHSRTFTRSDHVEFITNQLFGADIMPFAAHLAVIHLILQDINSSSNHTQIKVLDSTTLEVGYEISPRPNVILMNPPFTKKQRLTIRPKNAPDLTYRDKLKAHFSDYFSQNILTHKSPFYAYFLCLSDKLLGKNFDTHQFIGAVLPAIFLRNNNEKGLREFLLADYWIKNIIVREDKCNFSEDTSLREILLVLSKRSNLNEGEERVVQYVFLHDFTNYKQITDTLESRLDLYPEGIHEIHTLNDGAFSILNIPQNDLSSQNLFYPLSIFSFNYDFLHIWLKIREKKPFTSIKNLENIEIKTKNAPEPSKSNLSFRNTAILQKKYKKDSKDMILVESNTTEEEEGSIEFVDNSPTKSRIKVPKTHVKLGLRYISQKNKMDISDLEEYIICKNIKNLNFNNAEWGSWNTYLNDRTAHIAFVDRLDYTTPGYCLLAFYSEKERVIARTTGALKGFTKTYAKLITLWFNSSFGFLEWLIWRSPQRFGYCQHHIFTIEELVVPDESIVESSEIDKMMDELKDCEFPSLLEQYVRLIPRHKADEFKEILENFKLQDLCATDFEPRVILDEFIYKILVDNMEKNELIGLIKVLKDNTPVNIDIEIPHLRKIIKEEIIMSKFISNLHYRIAKFILLSKSAMEHGF